MSAAPNRLVSRHLRIGWMGLLVFVTAGLVLEAFHGFKSGFYLDADQTMRRMLWRLAHAHGTLISLVHLAFAFTVRSVPANPHEAFRKASWPLFAGLVLLPGGFFLGGFGTYGGDPGVGIFLAPVGALLLLTGVALASLGVRRSSATD
ncbi:MAG: hypothetical protein H6833_13040 [Planctomycetes bacterium]|nr:hypothetical protein [Planctomycetota bacterium]